MASVSNAFLRAIAVRLGGSFAVALLGALLLAEGCTDLGDVLPTTSPGDATTPSISELVPPRTFAGDTVQVLGSGFGTTPGRVVFTSNALRAVVDATVVTWQSNLIVVLSPAGAGDGPVRVQVGDLESDTAEFTVAPEVSFSNQVAVLFDFMALGPGRYNCASCHAYCDICSGGLSVLPHDLLMRGDSDHGPVVIPRRSASSLLLQRLLPSQPIPYRMPQDGLPSYMPQEDIQVIADWIDQGARDN